jgi:hypothetical protein
LQPSCHPQPRQIAAAPLVHTATFESLVTSAYACY